VHGDAFRVLYMALFGVTGQTSTQAALLQWLHSTGMTQWVTFGNTPSVFHDEVGPVVGLAVRAVARVVLGFAGECAGSATDAALQVDDHSESHLDLFSSRLVQALVTRTPVKPPLRAVEPLRRS